MTFEDIKKVNETLRTTDIKGKNYVEVNERIKAFRMLFPEGFIHTHIVSLEDGVVTMIAEVGVYFYNIDMKMVQEKILATGTAQEKESSSFINKTSFVENCETSAIGRALGMLGIGIDTSVASAEEVENAILNQEQKHVCADCGKEITDSKKTSGSVWKSADIAKYTLEKFGRELCADCGKKENDKNA